MFSPRPGSEAQRSPTSFLAYSLQPTWFLPVPPLKGAARVIRLAPGSKPVAPLNRIPWFPGAHTTHRSPLPRLLTSDPACRPIVALFPVCPTGSLHTLHLVLQGRCWSPSSRSEHTRGELSGGPSQLPQHTPAGARPDVGLVVWSVARPLSLCVPWSSAEPEPGMSLPRRTYLTSRPPSPQSPA